MRERHEAGQTPSGRYRCHDVEQQRQDRQQTDITAFGRQAALDPPRPKACQWIDGRPATFCGRPVSRGAYCESHAARVFAAV